MMEVMLGSACRLGFSWCSSGEPHGYYPEARVIDGVTPMPFGAGMGEDGWVDILGEQGVPGRRRLRPEASRSGCVGSLAASGGRRDREDEVASSGVVSGAW